MQVAIILSMFIFSLSMSISPGPVNMAIISSSVSNGFIKTFPFISGATIGFTLLLIFVGLGFSKIIDGFPIFFKLLELVGAFFIIYIGYKIVTSDPKIIVDNNNLIPSFIDGFLLQWLNPKAWIACASGVALFSTPYNNNYLIAFIVIYFFICYLSLIIWGFLGQKLTIVLNSLDRIRIFNFSMGGILILTSICLIFNMISG